MIVIMTITNMQNKLYTTQSSRQSVPEQRLQNPEPMDFVNFAKLVKQTKLLEKFELPNKRGFEPTEARKKDFCPTASPHS